MNKLTAPSGKLFAVAFIALASPPFPPMPVRKLHTTSAQNATTDRLVVASPGPGSPAS